MRVPRTSAMISTKTFLRGSIPTMTSGWVWVLTFSALPCPKKISIPRRQTFKFPRSRRVISKKHRKNRPDSSKEDSNRDFFFLFKYFVPLVLSPLSFFTNLKLRRRLSVKPGVRLVRRDSTQSMHHVPPRY